MAQETALYRDDVEQVRRRCAETHAELRRWRKCGGRRHPQPQEETRREGILDSDCSRRRVSPLSRGYINQPVIAFRQSADFFCSPVQNDSTQSQPKKHGRLYALINTLPRLLPRKSSCRNVVAPGVLSDTWIKPAFRGLRTPSPASRQEGKHLGQSAVRGAFSRSYLCLRSFPPSHSRRSVEQTLLPRSVALRHRKDFHEGFHSVNFAVVDLKRFPHRELVTAALAHAPSHA